MGTSSLSDSERLNRMEGGGSNSHKVLSDLESRPLRISLVYWTQWLTQKMRRGCRFPPATGLVRRHLTLWLHFTRQRACKSKNTTNQAANVAFAASTKVPRALICQSGFGGKIMLPTSINLY